MRELPFQLSIKQGCPKKQVESLTCTALLRAIPGSREVYDALWNGQSVIVKIFLHKIRGWYHLRREWRGLSLLQERGLTSPKPLFRGQTQDGKTATVVEKITDSSTVLEVLDGVQTPVEKLNLLILVCRELAKQHSKGVLQKDLHLGNFLLKGDRLFAFDTAKMQFLQSEVGRKNSISQLAMLARYLPADDTESIAKLCEEYLNSRGWQFGKSDGLLLQRQLNTHRRQGIKKGLKKSLRTEKRYQRMEMGNYLAVLDRKFCQDTAAFDFIKQIDMLMDRGQILKKGNTCYVSRANWGGRDIVIKRYNHKGLIHSLRCTMKRSRAKKCWLNGHLLIMLDIATPKPLAYIEESRGLLLWKSYLITEYVDGQKLCDFLRDKKVTEQDRSKMIQGVERLLDLMGKYRISHSDLKHSNILVTTGGIVLTDLDAMQMHKLSCFYKIRRTKDIDLLARGKKDSSGLLLNLDSELL